MSSQHLLSLKVLRLSKPSFNQKSDYIYDGDLDTIQTVGLTDFLQLPPAFGNIYLGETFTSYLCVNNDSLTAVQDVAFKAELQTASQRFTLADTIGSSPSNSTEFLNEKSIQIEQVSLLPRQSSEFILHHEIKELGIHILVCSVHYTPSSSVKQDSGRKFFRKFFKFQVLNPLAVKTKVNTLEEGRVLLELQIQNLSSIPLCLDQMKLEQNELFLVQDLNRSPSLNQNDPPSVFASKIIQPQDTRQYLYLLEPKDLLDISSRTSPNLGRLNIRWATTMGQTGHLQTAQLVRKVASINPFELSLLEVPIVKVEHPFKLKFKLQNNMSGERLRLSVHGVRSKMRTIILCGSNDHDVGPLDGGRSYEFELEFLALATGLHKIEGLLVNEKISGVGVDIDSLGLIQVIA